MYPGRIRIRDILIKIREQIQGEYCIYIVSRVDKDKGYIDLSKRRVSKEDIVFILYPWRTRIRDILI